MGCRGFRWRYKHVAELDEEGDGVPGGWWWVQSFWMAPQACGGAGRGGGWRAGYVVMCGGCRVLRWRYKHVVEPDEQGMKSRVCGDVWWAKKEEAKVRGCGQVGEMVGRGGWWVKGDHKWWWLVSSAQLATICHASHPQTRTLALSTHTPR